MHSYQLVTHILGALNCTGDCTQPY